MDILNLRRPGRILGFCLLVLLAALTASSCPVVASAANTSEYAVKAAFLSKFGAFVQWPPTTFPTPTTPLVLCVLGDDPFGSLLDDVAAGSSAGSHPLVVSRLSSTAAAKRCQIIFIGGDNPQRVAETVATARGMGVLTVTDTGAEASGVGIINFVVQGDRVRFGVDDIAAATDGLAISARLLTLAAYVKSKP